MKNITEKIITNEMWYLSRKIDKCNDTIGTLTGQIDTERYVRDSLKENLNMLIEDAKELGIENEFTKLKE